MTAISRSPDEAHLANVLGALALAVADRLDDDARQHGQTGLEQATLIVVASVPGMSQQDLQRRLGLSQPGTTRLIDRLVQRGLLNRDPGPDERTHALHLTNDGEAHAQSARLRRRQLLDATTSSLDRESLGVLSGGIDQMLNALVLTGNSPYRTCRLCDQPACTTRGIPCPVEQARLQAASAQPLSL